MYVVFPCTTCITIVEYACSVYMHVCLVEHDVCIALYVYNIIYNFSEYIILCIVVDSVEIFHLKALLIFYCVPDQRGENILGGNYCQPVMLF